MNKFGKWISVKDRLPDCDSHYGTIFIFLTYQNSFIKIGHWDAVYKKWRGDNHGDITDQVTHWMPLPEPPGAQEEPIKDWFERVRKARDEAGLGPSDLTGPWPKTLQQESPPGMQKEPEMTEEQIEAQVDAIKRHTREQNQIYKGFSLVDEDIRKVNKRLDALEKKVKELKEIKDKLHDMNIYELHERFVGVEKRLTGHSIFCSEKRFDDMEKKNNALEIRLFGEVMPLSKEVNGMDVTELQGTNIINTLFDRVNQLSRKVDNFQHTDCKIMKSLREKA